jgi:hypothetical protein
LPYGFGEAGYNNGYIGESFFAEFPKIAERNFISWLKHQQAVHCRNRALLFLNFD